MSETLSVTMSETSRTEKRFGGNADVNVGEKCRRHVGNMSERKMIENQYVIVLWEAGYRQ